MINKIIDNSELARMASKYFDSDSAKEMLQEIKDDIKKALKKEKIFVLHYTGRGTQEANEIEEVFISKQALNKYLTENSDYEGKSLEDIYEELEDGEGNLYLKEYNISK